MVDGKVIGEHVKINFKVKMVDDKAKQTQTNMVDDKVLGSTYK